MCIQNYTLNITKFKSYKPKPCMDLLFIKTNYLATHCLAIFAHLLANVPT